jgi:hypothetical protein
MANAARRFARDIAISAGSGETVMGRPLQIFNVAGSVAALPSFNSAVTV